MKTKYTLIIMAVVLAALTNCTSRNNDDKTTSTEEVQKVPSKVTMKLVDVLREPVITTTTKGCEDVKYGFECGSAFKVNGTYYLFSTENFDDTLIAASRLALWTSEDRINFSKHSVIAQTNFNWDDTTHRAATWSPNLVYDDDDELWRLYYVGYSKKPGSETIYNMSGEIMRMDSKTPGKAGIADPYEEGGWVEFTEGPDSWEGPAKYVSFFAYKVAGEWWSFYGSNSVVNIHDKSGKDVLKKQINKFLVGLAKAENGLEGKWTRQSELNPVMMDSMFIENPIVNKINDNLYMTVYDGANETKMSYAWSSDGINWMPEKTIDLVGKLPDFINNNRTPLGLIDEGDGTYTIYLTAWDNTRPFGVDPVWVRGFGHVFKVTVKLEVEY